MKKFIFILSLTTLLISCNLDTAPGLLMETESIFLFHGETAVLGASSENGLVYYKSSDSLVAEVDEKGVITANVVGTTYITVLDGKEAKACKVTVTPRFLVPINPYVNFGASVSEVKKAVKDVFIEELSRINNSSEKTLVYYNQKENEKSRIAYEYRFLNDKLISTGVYVNKDFEYFDNMMDYLDETYYYKDEFKTTAASSALSCQRIYQCVEQKVDLKVYYKIPVTEYYLLFSEKN